MSSQEVTHHVVYIPEPSFLQIFITEKRLRGDCGAEVLVADSDSDILERRVSSLLTSTQLHNAHMCMQPSEAMQHGAFGAGRRNRRSGYEP